MLQAEHKKFETKLLQAHSTEETIKIIEMIFSQNRKPLHRLNFGSCRSCACPHLHLARHVDASKPGRLVNQNSPTSSGRDGI